MKKITVDFSKKIGQIKAMHGVNNGPIPEGKFRGVNNFESFKALKIPYVRLHDSSFFSAYGGEHTVDIDAIFRDRNADENDPASYDFALTDYYVLSNINAGSENFYRLGSRIEHENPKYQTVPYEDFGKFARVCEHIIRHLCYGWKDGYNLTINYWEIWNEPDCWDDNYKQNPCWQGTEAQFLELYAVTSKHLKACFPELKIGGPAFASAYVGRPAFDNFYKYVTGNKLPLDFFSWHLYGTDPAEYAEQTSGIRKAFDDAGYTHTELVLDEWNYISHWTGNEHRACLHAMQNQIGAAFDAAVMLKCQKSPLDIMTYYDARGYCEFNGIWNPMTFEELKGYWAFMYFSRLYQMGTEIYSDSDSEDLYVGAAADGEKSGVELSYYRYLLAEEADVEITLTGLSGENDVDIRLTDVDHDNALIRCDRIACGTAKIYLHLKPNSVVYLDINKRQNG